MLRQIQNVPWIEMPEEGNTEFSLYQTCLKRNSIGLLVLNKLKQGGGSLLDRMRGREEEKSDPLTRTIRDRWVLRSEKVWWEGSGRQKGDETNHQLLETNRYQSTLAGGLHCLLFVHVTTDSGLDISGHIDLAQRYRSKRNGIESTHYCTGARRTQTFRSI